MDEEQTHDTTQSLLLASDVRTAMQSILKSEAFSSSKRCCDFLSYVVEQALAGAQHEIKERTVAVAVFGRTPSYDSHDDAIVRIKAGEVRKRLGQYYAGPGKQAPIHIALPTGGYVPVFTLVDNAEMVDDRSTKADSGQSNGVRSGKDRPTISPPSVVPQRRWKRGLALASGIVASGALAGFVWLHFKPSFVEQFWAPALHNSTPVYLVVAAAPVYVAYAPGENSPRIKSTEYVPTSDQYVGQGDMLASHLIAVMLQKMHQSYEVKASNTVDVRELPMRTVVLIGYSSTQWQSISKELRFYIDGDKAGMITDRGQDTQWYAHRMTKDFHTDEDYAIVSRFFYPGTRSLVVLVSGATNYGTEGAASLVTNSDLLRNALHDRPPGWDSKNLQIVLHMKVIANSPMTPEVVASYYW